MTGQHVHMQRADLIDLGVRDALAGQLAAHRFQAADDLESLRDILGAHLHDGCAAIRQQFHQAERGENLQRFAQRRARDAELLALQSFVEPRSGGKGAFDDHLLNLLDDEFVQSLRFDEN